MKERLRISSLVAVFFLAISLLSAFPAHAAYVRIPAAERGRLHSLGVTAHRTLDYGSFLWLELPQAELERLHAAGLAAAAEAQDFTLRLGEQSFDPLVGTPELPAGWQGVAGAADLHLVQMIGPLRASWRRLLEEGGLEIVQYIHPFTYVVWGELDAAAIPRAAEFVRWAGSFAPAFRVLPRWRHLSEEPIRVDVVLYRGADADAAVVRIEELGGTRLGRAVLDPRFELVTFAIAGDRLQAAAQIPGVYSIQPEPTDGGPRGEMSNQVNVNNVDDTNAALPGYPAWLAGVGLSGNGVIMANVDGGVEETHPDLAGRFLSCTGTTCSSTSNQHGTHTAGIMGADGSSGLTDDGGFLRGLGVAPGARMIEQVYNPHFLNAGGMRQLMTDSSANGALLSGNSWGPAGTPRGYDDDTMQVDLGVRDAEPATPGNQPLTYVLSFMNGYGGTSSQGTPDEAKNILTIGSTEMQYADGSQILAIDDLSVNSAHGPALDGRTIPHLVAPGCRVDSTVTGGSHSLLCGTSMASPHVTGAVALFVEYYRDLTGVDPSPALIKAAFLPVAHDLAGDRDADGAILGHPFDSKQGWGRLDLQAVVDPQVGVTYFDGPQLFGNSGEQWARPLIVVDPSRPLRLMLVWTDAPGHGLGGSTPAWNNDLDLVVEAGASTYLGNSFAADGWSQTGGGADGRNNTEAVFLGPTAPAEVTVRVVAADINSDGVPGQGDGTDQDFALVCYNCEVSSLFSDDFEEGTTASWSATGPPMSGKGER
ncbi:MAG: S8 family serine peptidase [bacterium]|nr:S8 family serine peptidase [bacterium]